MRVCVCVERTALGSLPQRCPQNPGLFARCCTANALRSFAIPDSFKQQAVVPPTLVQLCFWKRGWYHCKPKRSIFYSGQGCSERMMVPEQAPPAGLRRPVRSLRQPGLTKRGATANTSIASRSCKGATARVPGFPFPIQRRFFVWCGLNAISEKKRQGSSFRTTFEAQTAATVTMTVTVTMM